MKKHNPWQSRVYRRALFILPDELRVEGTDEMSQTFGDLLAAAPDPLARLLLLTRCLLALPRVAALEILEQILNGALKVSLIGIGIGLVGAAVTSQVLESRIWGVTTHDPRAFAGAAALLLATTLLAGWLPARRAAQIDPAETLRAE